VPHTAGDLIRSFAVGAMIAQQASQGPPPVNWEDLFSFNKDSGSPQDKKMSPRQEEMLEKKFGKGTIHEIKKGMGKGKDLFIDRKGNIAIRNKDGSEEAQPTDYNLFDPGLRWAGTRVGTDEANVSGNTRYVEGSQSSPDSGDCVSISGHIVR